jgi:hypothetical protein
MLATSMPASAAPLAGTSPTIEHSRSADVVVVTYREVLSEIADADRGPLLQIYGDGRMVVHYPPYMKRAGDYEQHLTAAELDQLLRSLADKGVLDFDATAARSATRASMTAARERARAANAPVTVFEAVDASTTVIEVAVDRYRSATPGAREVQNLSKRAWTGLRRRPTPSRRPALRALAAAEDELRASATRQDSGASMGDGCSPSARARCSRSPACRASHAGRSSSPARATGRRRRAPARYTGTRHRHGHRLHRSDLGERAAMVQR